MGNFILKEDSLIKLKMFHQSDVDIKKYFDHSFDLNENWLQAAKLFLDGPPELKSPNRGIANFILGSESPAEYDFENAVLLFESLKINPVQASDPRLWAYLSHGPYYEYIMSRFKPEKNKKNYEALLRNSKYKFFVVRSETLNRELIIELSKEIGLERVNFEKTSLFYRK